MPPIQRCHAQAAGTGCGLVVNASARSGLTGQAATHTCSRRSRCSMPRTRGVPGGRCPLHTHLHAGYALLSQGGLRQERRQPATCQCLEPACSSTMAAGHGSACAAVLSHKVSSCSWCCSPARSGHASPHCLSTYTSASSSSRNSSPADMLMGAPSNASASSPSWLLSPLVATLLRQRRYLTASLS